MKVCIVIDTQNALGTTSPSIATVDYLHKSKLILDWTCGSSLIIMFKAGLLYLLDIYEIEKESFADSSWFQTSLLLTALLFHRLITACCFRGAALSSHAALIGFSTEGHCSQVESSQLSAVSRCGQSGEVINWLAWQCSLLGLSSAASGACTVVQNSPSKWQCGKQQATLKAASDNFMRNAVLSVRTNTYLVQNKINKNKMVFLTFIPL